MANINRVHIKGWMPFDIVQNDEARSWLGIMNGLSYGLRIGYGGMGRGPQNENGGFTTYHRFEVSGEEAIWTAGGKRSVKYLVECLINWGAVLEEARAMHVEFDPNNLQWFDLLQEFPDRPQVQITPGNPFLQFLSPPDEEQRPEGGHHDVS